jgi:hypothetical protein
VGCRAFTWMSSSLLAACGLMAGSGAGAAPAGPPEVTEEERVAQAIERALQRHGPEVHRCFEQALADRLDSQAQRISGT